MPRSRAAARDIQRAAQVLREGGLVAFPTETVYGLGADAENVAAVRRIFAVKGRPADHPLIVHAVEPWKWTRKPSADALKLAKRFWPGPLTLILKKNSRVPGVVTGGQDTVGVRVPSHPAALALLKAFGGAVAAPSANRFGKVSPTTAAHVRQDLGADVDFVLDGGACEVGVESTIVDVSGAEPAILRHGGVTREQVEKALGRPVSCPETGGPRASGRLKSHYAPKARVVVAPAGELKTRAAAHRAAGLKVELIRMPRAKDLYARLRRADARGVDVVLVAAPPEKGLGAAVADRLRKAAAARAYSRSPIDFKLIDRPGRRALSWRRCIRRSSRAATAGCAPTSRPSSAPTASWSPPCPADGT